MTIASIEFCSDLTRMIAQYQQFSQGRYSASLFSETA
jgi:hypothetical protein